MRRLPLAGLVLAMASAGACSLVNAPADPVPGTSGTGGDVACTTAKDCGGLGDDCHEAKCVAGRCKLAELADGTSCDDGSKCTTKDVCKNGVCTGKAVSCTQPADPCLEAKCDETTGKCADGPGHEGAACDDGDVCTDESSCQGGVCTGPGCERLADECVDATCGAAGCEVASKLNGTPCGQSDCSNGQCADGHCNIQPVNEGMPCNDDLFCVIDETCQGGFCIGVPNPCPTGNGCIAGSCDEANKTCVATPIPEKSLCDDGDACTANEFCSNQVCAGGLPATVLFTEDFVDNSAGWTLGPEWQIGAAKASAGQQLGNPDPGTDYNFVGGVAGVEIGGNEIVASPDPVHAAYYLTSPVINANFAGSIYVTFYRWLNSDYNPYMTSTVEASPDGVNWTVVWTTNDYPINDDAWTFQALDVTAQKSATMQIRWGFSIDSEFVYPVSSWNIDHVLVQNAPCPIN